MSWSDIPGRAAYLWIYNEFLKTAPTNAVIVEVGVALGKSIAYCARRCIDLGRDDITIVAVDPWGGYARNGEQQASGPPTPDGDWELFQRTMTECAPEELAILKIVRTTSVIAAAAPGPVHLVVLDAAHDYESVRDDIAAWTSRLAPGGWIGGDDYVDEYPGVKQAVQEAFGVVEIRHEEGWGTWLHRG
jgi:cephalosporin hydroxylase